MCARAVGRGVGAGAHRLVLSGARVRFVARLADVHEQHKSWVPLMLEPSYRPNGWLGIMLGSWLYYYEFTDAPKRFHSHASARLIIAGTGLVLTLRRARVRALGLVSPVDVCGSTDDVCSNRHNKSECGGTEAHCSHEFWK